jgi:hypothetical protein
MKTVTLSFLFFSTLFLAACNTEKSATANGQTLFVEHYVRYDDEDKTIKATATFKIGDSLQNAKPTAIKDGVNLNNAPLKETKSDVGTNYNIDGPKDKFEAAYRFSFKNPLTQKLYETEFLMRQVTDIVVKDGKLDKKTGGQIAWSGGALADAEELSLRIEDAAGTNSEINIVGSGGNTADYNFRAGQLDELKPGKVKIYAVRTHTARIGQPNTAVKGTLKTQYFAKPIEVVVQ